MRHGTQSVFINVFLAALGLLILLPQSYAAMVLSDPVEINSSANALGHDFYIDDSLNLNLVWEDSSDSSIYYAKAGSSGALLVPKTEIAEDSANPLIEKKSVDHALFWQAEGSPGIQGIFYATGNISPSISLPELLSSKEYSSTNPVTSSSYNYIYSAWESLVESQKSIFYRKLGNDYWSDERNITSGASNATNPSLSSRGSNLYASWIDDRDGSSDKEIYFRMYKGNTNIDNSYPDSDHDGLVDVLEQGYDNNTNSTYNDQDPSSTTNYTNLDSDGDGLPDGWIDGWFYDASSRSWKINYSARDGIAQPWEGEDLNLNGRVDPGETDPNNPDSDNDGMPDGWERWYGLDALSDAGINGAAGDFDSDTVPNIAEYGNHTNPASADSDNDGLTDAFEIMYGIDPNNPDTDNDGLIDGMELCLQDVDNDGLIGCLDNDSDNDGVLDGYEMYETMMYSANCGPLDDCDNDGLPNVIDPDSDNDGIPDGIEFQGGLDRISPVKKDTDGDGIPDSDEDKNKNGILDPGETDPRNPDTDGDGLWDGNFTYYYDDNGLWQRFEFGEMNSGTNPRAKDTDGDGLDDWTEVFGWDIYVNGRLRHVDSDPLDPNSDQDSYCTDVCGPTLNDYEEYLLGTDPRNYDTDGDLILDFYEVNNTNTNPYERDTDNDGVLDGVELYYIYTDPLIPDTDQDGLLDSEGSWVMFRTNATGSSGGSTIETFTGSGGGLSHNEYTLQGIPSSFVRVSVNKTGGTQNITLNLGSDPLQEYEYRYVIGGCMGDGYVYLWRDLTAEETLHLSYLSLTGLCISEEAAEYPPSSGATSPVYVYGLTSVTNILVEVPVGFSEITLTSNSSLGINDYFYETETQTLYLSPLDPLTESETLTVEYLAKSAIDYAAPENDNSWIAASDESLEHPLVPYGRIDGLVITDAQLSKDITHYPNDYLGITNENYNVVLFESEALHDLIPGISQRFNSVAWNPDGEFALMAGQAVGSKINIYKMYKNTSYEMVSYNDSRSVRDIAWTPDGSYALLVGDSGLIIKYDASADSFEAVDGISNNLKAATFTREYDALMNNLGLIVGDGTILRINISNNNIENFTVDTGLGSTSYNYIDVAPVYGNYVVIITSDAKAFMYNWYMADLQMTFTLGPTPTSLNSADWKYGLDEKSGKFIHNGIFTGKSGSGNYIYYCDFSGVCSNRVLHYATAGTLEVSDAKWSPGNSDIIITMKETYDNPIGNKGAIFKLKFGQSTSSLLEIVSGSMLTNIGWHPSGDYAYIVSESVKSPFTLLYSYLNNPFVIIDVPGNSNPVYGSPDEYKLASEAFEAFTGRGLIPPHAALMPSDPLNSVTEYRKEIMFTDPLNPKTYDDGLLDGQRFSLGDWDADGDFIANMFDVDADNDGILNGEEIFWNANTDGDVNTKDTRRQPLINALDADSDNDGVNDTYEVRVVFRINNRSYGPGSWVGVQLGDPFTPLDGFVYSGNITYNISSLAQVNHSMIGKQYPVDTPDDYYVFYNGTHIFIDVPGPKFAVYAPGSIPNSEETLNLTYSLTHRETYTAGSMLGNDSDNDLLDDSIDPTPGTADTDGDGLIDGLEHDWNSSTDGDMKKNYQDKDSDNDGLPDGWIDGWCYNASQPGHPDSIPGWGPYCTPDGIKQLWEGEDLNLDGGAWWSERITITNDGTTKELQSETNPLWPDTDFDGLLDGEERLYGTDPIRGNDLDGDGIKDSVEIKEYFMADSVNIGDYFQGNMRSSSLESVFKEEWNGYKYINSLRLSGTGITVPLKLLKRGYYKINLLGSDLDGSAWIEIKNDRNQTVYKPIAPTALSQGNNTIFSGQLDAGIYEVTIDGVADIWVHRLTAYKLGLDYNNSDTDGDGIIDGEEEGYGYRIFSGPDFKSEDLFATSPLDPDSDDDGLLDGEELRLGTNPLNPDTDGDGVNDKHDLMPLNNLNIGNPWGEIFPSHTLYYDTEYYLHFINGQSSSVGCVLNIGDSCASETYTDLGTEGTRNSPRDNATKEYTVEKGLNPELGDTEPWELDYNNLLVYDVVNMSYGVEKEGYDRLYSISTDRSYSYGKTGIVAAIDAYPKYKIDYNLRGEAFTVTLANAQPSVMMEGIGWVQQSDKSMVQNESTQQLKYVYATQEMMFDIGKNQQLTFQLSIDPKEDLMDFTNASDYIIPALEYRLYDGSFSWATGVMSSYAIAKPIEIIATRHSYEFTMSFPKDKMLKDHYILYVSPIYMININGRIMRYPLNNFKFNGAALVRTVEGHSYSLIAKLSEDIIAINDALPDDISTYSNGMHNFGSYDIYLYKGEPESFDPTAAQAALSTADAIVAYSSSEADANYMMGKINFTDNVWSFNYSDAFSNQLKAYSTIKETKKFNYYFDSFYSLQGNVSQYATNFKNDSKTYISGVKYSDSGQPYNYAVGKNDVLKTKSSTTEEITTRSITQSLSQINQSSFLQDEQYERIIEEMENAPDGSVASITQDESIIYHIGIDGMTITSNITRIANAAKGLYDDYGADFIEFGKSVKSIRGTLKDAGNGKVSLGIFQKSFLPPNVPGKFVSVGFGDIVDLGIGAATMSYQFYVAQNTEDPIMRKAAYEDMAATGVGMGFTVAAIMFPPAAVIEPTWVATYYAIWGPLILADKLGIVHVDQGPFGEIAKNPAETIVFVVQAESGISIPSAVALNAFNAAFEDQKELIEDWYKPSIIVEPQ